jgi:hydroxymethylpyrimidine/phosphomethylpyrimidine kinase
MLGSGEVASAVCQFLESRRLPNLVLDPVIRSSSGTPLLDDSGLRVLRSMLSLFDVITPNIAEAAALLSGDADVVDKQAEWEEALPEIRLWAAGLHKLRAKAVIVTGGHLKPPNDFLSEGCSGQPKESVIPGEHIESPSTHGTGCAFATAIACRLALGDDLAQAARTAKEFVRKAIESAYLLGKGTGPVNPSGSSTP